MPRKTVKHTIIFLKNQCWVGLQLLGADESIHMDASMQTKLKIYLLKAANVSKFI